MALFLLSICRTDIFGQTKDDSRTRKHDASLQRHTPFNPACNRKRVRSYPFNGEPMSDFKEVRYQMEKSCKDSKI